MLFNQDIIRKLLSDNGVKVTGVLHVGAHDCEENDFYRSLNLENSDIYWIDALIEKVISGKIGGIANIYQAVISDTDNQEVDFFRTNNDQSSSILELDTHRFHYPHIQVIEKRKLKTITLDSFVRENKIPIEKCNLWNFDIQGAELLALKGATESLKSAQVLYLEVNEEYLYKNCSLISEIDSFLDNLGFKRILTEMTSQKWGDAIYIRI